MSQFLKPPANALVISYSVAIFCICAAVSASSIRFSMNALLFAFVFLFNPLSRVEYLTCSRFFIKDVDDNFDAFGISAMNDENGYQTGRPYDGLAVLWRKEFTHACTLLNLDDVRLLGVAFDTNLGKMLLVKTYLPYQCADNFEDDCNCLGKIAAIVHEADTRNIVITGDFNAGVNTLFEHELVVELCKCEH